MRVEGRYNINDPQFSKMPFMEEYQDDILQFYPLSAQAGKPVPPDSLE
jgi:hypothetical protein